MENISFRNVQLTILKVKETENFGGNIDLRPATDQSMRFFERDLPGFLAKHINGLDLEKVKIIWGPGMPAYYSNALETQQVLGLEVEKFEGIANPASNLSEPFRYFKTTFKHREELDDYLLKFILLLYLRAFSKITALSLG